MKDNIESYEDEIEPSQQNRKSSNTIILRAMSGTKFLLYNLKQIITKIYLRNN